MRATGSEMNTLRKVRVLAIACITSLAAFGVAACGRVKSGGGGGGGGGGGDINVAMTSFPDYVDPQLSYTLEGWEVLWNVYTPSADLQARQGQGRHRGGARHWPRRCPTSRPTARPTSSSCGRT